MQIKKSINNSLIKILPQLKSKGLKGENGRIGVIGGSYEFSGAPFYSAISALKTGGDLAHIFCSKAASNSIKTYSPEIIVHPVFVSKEEHKIDERELPAVYETWISKIQSWEKAINSWVIGPGLGRDPYMNHFFPLLVRNIAKNKVIIFDADGIYYLTKHPELFEHLRDSRIIITPNKKELGFLKPYINFDSSQLKVPEGSADIEQLPTQFERLHNFSMIIKGEEDIILGCKSYVVRTPGGYKRCGGIGDILAGVTSVCSMWNFELGPVLAAQIVKTATKKAYEKEGRGLTAPSIIHELSHTVKEIESKGQN